MKKVTKKFLIVASILLCLSCFGFGIYVSDYYESNIDVNELISKQTKVTTSYLNNGDLLFEPVDNSYRDCIIFYPGGKVEYSAYGNLMLDISKKDVTCLLMKMPFNLAIFDINKANDYDDFLNQYDNVYLAGHSLGGVSAAMCLSDNVDKFKGLVLLGAYSTKDLSDTNLKILSIYGEFDEVLNRDKYKECLLNLPINYEEHIIEGGCHAYFGNYGFQKGDGQALIDDFTQQETTSEIIVQWIKN